MPAANFGAKLVGAHQGARLRKGGECDDQGSENLGGGKVVTTSSISHGASLVLDDLS